MKRESKKQWNKVYDGNKILPNRNNQKIWTHTIVQERVVAKPDIHLFLYSMIDDENKFCQKDDPKCQRCPTLPSL